MPCEKLVTCPFYNEKMPIDSGLGAIYKKNYCEGEKTQCARYRISAILGKEFVPSNLYPNMNAIADQVIQRENQKRSIV